MITLTINNSYSKITGATPAQEKHLRSQLSYIVGGKSSYYSGYETRRKSLLTKNCEFPTGLIHRIPWPITIKDARIVPKALCEDLPGIHYSWQVNALNAAIRNHRGILSAPTGTGKSRLIAMLGAAYSNLKILVVVPSLETKRQLVESLKDLKNMHVENIDSRQLFKLRGFDVLIIDEAHHVAAKTYQKLNKTAWTNIYYRFFITATPFRNDAEEMLLFEAIAGTVIYQLTYKEAVKQQYIVPVEAYYLEVPQQKTDAHTWAEVYSQLVVNNTVRNEIIALFLLKLESVQTSTLCLVKEVKHGQILSGLTNIPFVSGAYDESRDFIRQFNNGEVKVLIGTQSILGEGIDTKPCEFVVMAGLGKAKSQFMQAVGRSVRAYPEKESAKIVLLQDKSHKFTLRHFKEQAKILLTEYGTQIIKLEGI